MISSTGSELALKVQELRIACSFPACFLFWFPGHLLLTTVLSLGQNSSGYAAQMEELSNSFPSFIGMSLDNLTYILETGKLRSLMMSKLKKEMFWRILDMVMKALISTHLNWCVSLGHHEPFELLTLPLFSYYTEKRLMKLRKWVRCIKSFLKPRSGEIWISKKTVILPWSLACSWIVIHSC